MRIAIIGGPKTGKTTLAAAVALENGVSARGTDELMETHGWSELSLAASLWLDEEGPWVYEGVALVRAIRKWLDRNPTGKPCDKIIYLRVAHGPLLPGQRSMTTGHETVWRGIEQQLRGRGVEIEDELTK